MSGLSHTLSHPITAHGEQVSVLELEEPTAKLAIELGYPYIISVVAGGETSGSMQMQLKVTARYISRLAKIPLTAVESMAISDLMVMQGWLMGFFNEAAPPET